MKKTPIFEEVFLNLFKQRGIGMTILIGGLLSFIPILNFFAFGYLYRWSNQIRRQGRLELLDWNDFGGYFVDGIRFAIVWILYWLIPVIGAWGLYRLFAELGLSRIAFLLFSVVLLLAPILMSAALYRLQHRNEIRDLLKVGEIIRIAGVYELRMLIPALVAFAFLRLCPPFYGFALFAGFLVVLGYSSVCFHFLERSRPANL
ncbi:DUF4013 domain-containing protein [Coraliomargarita akajimensis]|uniref:DUF4013 domain-containing protein n=1 Tax=Coraliomargarita akajimensis (strain DSM 45221 / IAM 15411 / JCM 23193 / KCTC 12865 / 04OKA010-24) TaxID=583355 RepID=D5EHV5_CORAD|nr:DUF4013 domain-containing protein [Coraliomargarita akajimensis]ADE54146.1 hypothetical protein Caka_1125 [Coraliomargarita akajimensis DSM 45221]